MKIYRKFCFGKVPFISLLICSALLLSSCAKISEAIPAESASDGADIEEYSECTQYVSSAELSGSVYDGDTLTLQNESPVEETVFSISSDKLTASGDAAENSYSALNYDIQKGVWISYLEYTSMMQQKSEREFRRAVEKCFDNVASIGFNTVYVHARAYGDAYYDSELFPAGDRYDGKIDTKPAYDALEIMVEEAHERSLSIHAWVNPMRLMTDKQMKELSDSYQIKKWYNSSSTRGRYIVKYNDRWYLNPAYSKVTTFIADGIAEIVSNYEVDGIQIDDYFYPTTDASFDSRAYASADTEKSLSDWRMSRVNTMVKKLCRTVHGANPTAVFGISPQGSVENDYDELFADVKTWCGTDGYCDYILPQIYFGFDNAALPYDKTIAQWSAMTSGSDVKLVIGLAAYKVGLCDSFAGSSGKNEWINNNDVLARQMKSAGRLDNYGGVALFRYGSLFEPERSVSAQVSRELGNIPKKR